MYSEGCSHNLSIALYLYSRSVSCRRRLEDTHKALETSSLRTQGGLCIFLQVVHLTVFWSWILIFRNLSNPSPCSIFQAYGSNYQWFSITSIHQHSTVICNVQKSTLICEHNNFFTLKRALDHQLEKPYLILLNWLSFVASCPLDS